MTDRELMQQALEAMGAVGADAICEASHHAKKDQHKWGEPCPLQQRWHIAYQALRERLARQEQEPWEQFYPDMGDPMRQEPVAHSIVAGALFDFMGWLTSRKERLILSSVDEASPAVEVIKQFAVMRDLSLDDAKVQEWQTLLAPSAASGWG